jgi:CRP-like cAMP-binding protein
MILQNEKIFDYLYSLAATDDRHITIVHFNKKDLIITQERIVKNIYIIKEGIVKCFISEDSNKNLLLEFLGVGEIIGEVETILNCKNIASIQSVTKSVLYKIDLDYFKNILLKETAFKDLLIHELARRLQKTAIRSSSQQLNTIQSSLANLLCLLKNQDIIFKKTDLADYLGISVRSLNRELKILQDRE